MIMNNSAGTSLATTTSSADRVSQISDAINITAVKDFDVVLKDTQEEAVAQHTCETDYCTRTTHACTVGVHHRSHLRRRIKHLVSHGS